MSARQNGNNAKLSPKLKLKLKLCWAELGKRKKRMVKIGDPLCCPSTACKADASANCVSLYLAHELSVSP